MREMILNGTSKFWGRTCGNISPNIYFYILFTNSSSSANGTYLFNVRWHFRLRDVFRTSNRLMSLQSKATLSATHSKAQQKSFYIPTLGAKTRQHLVIIMHPFLSFFKWHFWGFPWVQEKKTSFTNEGRHLVK